MIYKRFFSFGCSFTQYEWPTWADIVAKDLSIEFYNYGDPGIGNVAISSNIVYADAVHNFQETDLICIVWSHWNREDRVKKNNWVAGGNIFNNPFYDIKFIKKYWDFDNDIIKNSTAIILTNKAYKNIIKFQGHIADPGDFEIPYQNFNKNKNERFKTYLPLLHSHNVFKDFDSYHFDIHPSVKGHLDYVRDFIYSDLNLQLNTETVDYYNTLHNKLKKIGNKKKISKFLEGEKNK